MNIENNNNKEKELLEDNFDDITLFVEECHEVEYEEKSSKDEESNIFKKPSLSTIIENEEEFLSQENIQNNSILEFNFESLDENSNESELSYYNSFSSSQKIITANNTMNYQDNTNLSDLDNGSISVLTALKMGYADFVKRNKKKRKSCCNCK